MKKLFNIILTGCMALTSVFTTVSCFPDEVAQESYYTFTGEMVTDWLTNRNEDFSEFSEVLQRAELWDLLSTYGTFTCFAPTNQAINEYLKGRGYASVADMPEAECDTLAWMHLFKIAYYTTDLGDGQLPTTNLNNRYLTLSCDTLSGNVVYHINASEMVARDDSVENGVVHVVDRVITASSVLLAEMVVNDPKLSIFGQALKMTGLADMIDSHIEDETYTIDPDSTLVLKGHTKYFGGKTWSYRFPAIREFKYTIFAEPDSILNQRGIKDINDLIAYANKVYHDTYPKDLAYDNDYTNRRNPLNRFVAYHILDRRASYDELTLSGANEWSKNARSQWLTDKLDIQAFYETVCPYTIMKVSDAGGQKYVNRKGVGTNKVIVKGSRIFTASESLAFNPGYSDARNGNYFYVDNMVVYDNANTIGEVLNTRIRIDATTLSPDFMNTEARNVVKNSDDKTRGAEWVIVGFKPGFCKNFIFGEDTFYGVCERYWCNSFENDMCGCLDNFDIKFRLPPVPAGKTYEVRLGYQAGTDRTVVQIYFDDNLTGNIPCGIPVDLRKFGQEYGFILDNGDEGMQHPEPLTEEEKEANDKALRNQGFMKGPDSFCHPQSETTMRQNGYRQCLRRILTTRYFEEEHDYYIRLRQVLDNNAEMSLDYIEIVPKSVYNGKVAEDRL